MINFQDLIEKPRRAARSYSELLPWFGMVSPGLVLCQDGSLLAAFALRGADVEGKEDYFSDQKIDLFQAALRVLNDRCTIWSVQERRFVEGYLSNEFTNPVAARIDREWQADCERRRNARLTQRLFVGYKLPNMSEGFFDRLSSEIKQRDGAVFSAIGAVLESRYRDRGAVARVRGQLGDLADEFEKVISAFVGIVETSLGIERLQGADLLGELHRRANLASQAGPINPPPHLAYLNTLLAGDTIERQHDMLKAKGLTAEVYVAALSMEGTPPEAHSHHIDQLMVLDCEFVLVQTFKQVDRLVAEKAIQKAEQFYRTEVKSVTSRVAERLFGVESEKVNTGNLSLAQDAQDALVDLTAGEVAYGYYNCTVLALGESQRETNRSVDLLASSMRASGYALVRERHGLMSAMLATLPGNGDAALRFKLISTANLADLAPLRTINRGERIHPLISRDFGYEVPPLCRFATPCGVSYDFNPHEGDLGHTAVIGGSGAGKTSLMTLLISQFSKYRPSQTFVFDKDYSLMLATVLHGGRHIDMGGHGKTRPRMNPVAKMMRNADDGQLRQWIEVLVAADGHSVISSESTTIHAAIQDLRQAGEQSWTLRGLYAAVRGADGALASKFAAYVDLSDDLGRGVAGSHAAYFDNDEDDFTLASLVGMECGGLLDDPKVATPFMQYAFYCIDKTLDGKTPTLIYLEEAWYLFANPVFATMVENWLRTFRKKRAFVMFATQSLEEIARLPNLASFVSNIPTQILLPSITSSVMAQAELYREVFGINEQQLHLLSQAIPKRNYLLVKPTTTRFVTTQMPPTLVAINEATTLSSKREAARQYADAGGADWQDRFLREVLKLPV